MNRFPHLHGSGDFPGSGRELYEQIPGAFDYSEWGEGAKLTLTSVPWGVYAPGVAADRPGFDTEEAREKWFAQHLAKETSETHYLQTRVRYQINDYVEIPFTFDYASRYNYLFVEYPSAPVPSGDKGLRKWFFHITDIRYGSPSSTTVSLTPDWWVTIAPLMEVNHMILERGHAPVAVSSADDYLSAPIDNSEYLLSPDIDYGGRSVVASHDETVYNSGDVYAVICMRGVPISGDFADYRMPFNNSTISNGVPSDWQFCILATDLPGFLNVWQANAAQSMQAMDALYLIGDKLLKKGSSVEVFGYTCYNAAQGGSFETTVKLDQDKFGFPDSIKHLAKLYTYPYSFIELADESGSTIELRVENLTEGAVKIESALNGAFPWLTVSAHVTGYGGARSVVTFSTCERNEFGAGGFWYDTLKSWGVPCYKINQSAAQAYDYHTHFSRIQQTKNAETSYDNAVRSANTANENALAGNETANANAKNSNAAANANALASNAMSNENSLASNATAQTNATNSANNMSANNALTVAMNNAVTATSIDQGLIGLGYSNSKLKTDTQYDIGNSNASFDADMAQLAVAATNNDSTAALGTIAAAATIVGGAVSGDAGSALGGVADLVNTGAQWAATNASITVSQSNNTSVYDQAITSAYGKQDSAIDFARGTTQTNNNALNANNTTKNNAATSITDNNVNLTNTNASNTKATADANANRSKETADANANRTKTTADSNADSTKATADANADRSKETALANSAAVRANAYAAIDNAIKEAAMGAPVSYGLAQNGEYSNTRPMMLSVNVVTESKSAIKQAATQFLRYGYALGQAWDFESWNLMKNFTYWKVSDVWATGVNKVPEEGQDVFRRMLYDGVTVWRDPDMIGKVSIYDN